MIQIIVITAIGLEEVGGVIDGNIGMVMLVVLVVMLFIKKRINKNMI